MFIVLHDRNSVLHDRNTGGCRQCLALRGSQGSQLHRNEARILRPVSCTAAANCLLCRSHATWSRRVSCVCLHRCSEAECGCHCSSGTACARTCLERTVHCVHAKGFAHLVSCRSLAAAVDQEQQYARLCWQLARLTPHARRLRCCRRPPPAGFKALCEAFTAVTGDCKPYSITGSLPCIRDLQEAGFDVQTLGFGKLAAYHSNNGEPQLYISRHTLKRMADKLLLLVPLCQTVMPLHRLPHQLDPDHLDPTPSPSFLLCAAHVRALVCLSVSCPFRVWLPVRLCQGLQGAAGAAGGVQQVKQ